MKSIKNLTRMTDETAAFQGQQACQELSASPLANPVGF